MFYFAYGSNMNEDRMKTRKTDFEYRGLAYLRNYRLAFNKVAGATTTTGFVTGHSLYPKTFQLKVVKELDSNKDAANAMSAYMHKRAAYMPARQGYANVVQDAGGIVEGALYVVPPDAFKELDRHEGHPTHYCRTVVDIELPNGVIVQAVTYIATQDKIAENLFPNEEYLGHLFKGVDILSEDYYRELSVQETIEVKNPQYKGTTTNHSSKNYNNYGAYGY